MVGIYVRVVALQCKEEGMIKILSKIFIMQNEVIFNKMEWR